MLLPLLWLYYITFWPVSKTYFSTPLEVVAKFFFCRLRRQGGGEGARTPRAPARGGCPLQPCFHSRVMRQTIGSGELQRIFLLATLLSLQGDAAANWASCKSLLEGTCNPAFTPG